MLALLGDRVAASVDFYVIDSHRPIALANVYTEGGLNSRVRCLVDEHEDLESRLPSWDQVYYLVEGEGDEPVSFADDPTSCLRYKKWCDDRDKVLFEYYTFTYRAVPSAVLIFRIALLRSMVAPALLWWVAVSVTEAYVKCRITADAYFILCSHLNDQLAVVRNKTKPPRLAISGNVLIDVVQNETMLVLYRRWSLYESILNSPATFGPLQVWNESARGIKKFLLDIGCDITTSKQRFMRLSEQRRANLIQSVIRESGNWDDSELASFQSFICEFSSRSSFSASDLVHVMWFLINSSQGGQTLTERFLAVLSATNRVDTGSFDDGVSIAKNQLAKMFQSIGLLVCSDVIAYSGNFMYCTTPAETAWLTCTPAAHFAFAEHLLKAYAHRLKSRMPISTASLYERAKKLPFVLLTPVSDDGGWVMVSGVPPMINRTEGNWNLFPMLFEASVASLGRDSVCWCSFDRSTFSLPTKHKARFLRMLCDNMEHIV